MSIDLSALRTYILANYAQQAAARQDATIAAALNAPTGTRVVSTHMRRGSMIGALGMVGISVAAKMRAFLASTPVEQLASLHSATVEAWPLIETQIENSGLDVGRDDTRTMLDSLVTAGVLTSDEVDAIKALANRPSSIAYQQFGEPVSVSQVSAALSMES